MDYLSSLSDWSKKKFGSERKNLKEARNKLRSIRNSPIEQWDEELHLQNLIHGILEGEEIKWLQRSRVNWLRESDTNTSLFHAKASQRKKRNKIESITDSAGSVCEWGEEIEKFAIVFFPRVIQTNGA